MKKRPINYAFFAVVAWLLYTRAIGILIPLAHAASLLLCILECFFVLEHNVNISRDLTIQMNGQLSVLQTFATQLVRSGVQASA